MKYMTFNSACSYAGVANMLELYGVETDDRTIALGMNLPYLFDSRDGAYLAGPMLQSAEWFNLYLNPIGYQLEEQTIPAETVTRYLKKQKTAMLGLRTETNGKHAFVYIGAEGDQFVFLNNKWRDETAPDKIRLTEEELRERIDSAVVVATLQKIRPASIDFSKRLKESVAALRSNLSDILELCEREESIEVLRSKLNTLFRPLLLDGITMLSLINETELAEIFTGLQRELLSALRQDPDKIIMLKNFLSIETLQSATERYIDLIVGIIGNCQVDKTPLD